MLIPFAGPLDLASTLESGQAFRWRREDDWYCGVVFGSVVKLRQEPEGIEFHCAPGDEASMEPLLHDYLRLGDDLEAIYESINIDERMAAATAAYPGMRLLRQEPWECLISFICSANSNIPRISTNVEDMSNAFGRPLEFDSHRRCTFPTPGDLADAGEGKLRELGLGFRAKYVAAAAETAARGGVDLFALREASYDETLAALTALPGVGDKVANCVMLFSLDKLEAFPVDVWITRAVDEWYLSDLEDGDRPAKKDVRPWMQRRFGLYAGYANQYLFHGRRLQGRG